MSNIKIHEGIRDSIVKLLMMSKIKKAIASAKKVAEDDPTTMARLDTIKYNYEQLDKELGSFCERNPELDICKDRSKPKARWK